MERSDVYLDLVLPCQIFVLSALALGCMVAGFRIPAIAAGTMAMMSAGCKVVDAVAGHIASNSTKR